MEGEERRALPKRRNKKREGKRQFVGGVDITMRGEGAMCELGGELGGGGRA